MPNQDQGESSFEKTMAVAFGSTPAGELQLGSIVGGSYKLKSILDGGGMGVVYLAEHQFIQREYALKTLAPDKLNEANWNRFQSESKAIAKLEHRNIVKIYDMGIAGGGCPFYVMDLLERPSLAEFIRTNGPLSVDQREAIFALGDLKPVLELKLRSNNFDGKCLAEMKWLRSVENLDLSRSIDVDPVLNGLKESRALQALSLNDTTPSTECLDGLSTCPRLGFISLINCGIDDKKLEAICKISSVRTLSLKNSAITGQSLKQLLKLKQLKHCSLTGSQVTKDDLEEVKRQMPRCQFEWP